MNNECVQIGDFTVAIVRHPKRKRLCLERNHNNLVAKAPLNMAYESIASFVYSQREWLYAQYAHISDNTNFPLTHQSTIVFQGENKNLLLQTNTYDDVSLQANNLYLTTKKDDAQNIKNTLLQWYKQQALQYAITNSQKFAHCMQLQFDTENNIEVREYKRRWGSCNSRQIKFNWRLIMAPSSVFDYVIVHELAHLIEFNHSRRFWSIVAMHQANWRTSHQWLKDKGHQLYRI